MSKNRKLLVAGLLAMVLLPGMCAFGQMLFYATSSASQNSNSVEHVTPAGTANWSIFTATGSGGNNVSRCTAIALDTSLQKVFLVDAGNQELWSMNLDGTGLSLVKAGLTNTPTDLAVDTVNQKIYYTTSSSTTANNTIQRMDYTGNNNTVLFTAGASGNNVTRCTALALDLNNSLIIFSDAGVKGLWSVNLGGSSLTLVKSNLTAVPLDLALDVANQFIYYATSSFGQNSNTVQKLNYSGTANTLLFTASGAAGNGVSRCTAIEFDPVGSKLYLADAGTNALWSLNSDGTGLSQVEPGLLPTPRRVRFIPLVSSITVVNANDSGPGSLRQAILSSGSSGLIDFSSAIFNGSSNTINLATVGDTTFGPSAIIVTNQITIAGLTGTNGIIIARSNGAPAMRLFYVSPGGVLSLKNLTLTNGLAHGGAGGSGFQRGGSGGGGGGIGGAIFDYFGTLDLENITLVGNQAVGGAGGGGAGGGDGSGGGGGGMSGNGSVGGGSTTGGNGGGPSGGLGGSGTAAGGSGGTGGGGGGGGSSPTSGSGSGAGGGGGFAGGGGGGGAYNTVGYGGGTGGGGGGGGFGGGGGGPGGGTPGGAVGQPGFGGGGSGLTDNTGNVGSAGGGGAGIGGGVFNLYGLVTVTNCTFSGNIAMGGQGGTLVSSIGTNGMGLGGGLFNVNGAVYVVNSTFASNQANQGGGGIFNLAYVLGAGVSLRNSILAYTPSAASDYEAMSVLSGTTTNLGNNNLIQVNNGFAGGIVSSADPLLAPLRNNGGPTWTHVPLNHSPAIDAGDNTALPPTDQRGYPRIADGDGNGFAIVDLGAVEDGLVRLTTVPQTLQSILLNGYELSLTGETNRDYVIQASTNLSTWTALSTNLMPASGLTTLFDSAAGSYQQRFYRAHSLP